MTANRGLPHELLNNPRAEAEFLDILETERKSQYSAFQQYQRQASTVSGANKSQFYRSRDDAFFKNLNLARQLKSKVRLVNDYQQPISMPKIQRADAKIRSILEQHDPNKTAYLASIKEFLDDKKNHDSTVRNLEKEIADLYIDARNLVMPQILYFLLVYLTPIFAIYRWFKPFNALDTAIALGSKFDHQIEKLKQELQDENDRYNKKWEENNAAYLTMDGSEELAKLVNDEEAYSQLVEHYNALTVFIMNSDQPNIQKSFSKFKTHPNYIHLFQLYSALCTYKFDMHLKQENVAALEQVMGTLQELYPEVQKELREFEMATLENLSESSVYELLQSKYQRYAQVTKNIQQQIERAQLTVNKIAQQTTKLNKKDHEKLIYKYNLELKRNTADIELKQAELAKHRKFLEPLKDFLTNKTGESLKRLYLFTLDPNNGQVLFSATLKKLYPLALEELVEIEPKEIVLSNSGEIFKLLDKYLAPLIQLVDSNDVKLQPYKEVAQALRHLLSVSDWTWEHFWVLEKAIQNNPGYFRHPLLADLVTDVAQLVEDSRTLQARADNKPRATKPVTPELIINQANPLPTFFQPPTRVSSAANALLREILGNINSYSIRYSDERASSDQKQKTIAAIGNNMLSYIGMLSTEDAIQNISPQHLDLLRDLIPFITRLSQQPATSIDLNERDFAQIQTLLKQLAPEHPVREVTEFLIRLYKTKIEYMAIDTQYEQRELSRNIKIEMLELEKIEKRHKNRRSHGQLTSEQVFNIDKWGAARSLIQMIHGYADNLRKYSSESNAEEYSKIEELEPLMEEIYQILREGGRKHKNLPDLLEQYEQIHAKLGNHPISTAATNAIENLKQTKEYTESEELGQKLQRR